MTNVEKGLLLFSIGNTTKENIQEIENKAN